MWFSGLEILLPILRRGTKNKNFWPIVCPSTEIPRTRKLADTMGSIRKIIGPFLHGINFKFLFYCKFLRLLSNLFFKHYN